MATSQNGWTAGQDRRALGVDQEFSAGGVLIAGGVLAGDVAAVLGYVAEQFHRRVERLVSGWCWGHAYRPIRGQTTGLSNHASGTAMDLNAPRHPQGRRGTFSAAAVREIRSILAEVGGVVRWGGEWSGSSVDEMHFEITGSRAQVAAVAARLRGPKEDDMSLKDLLDERVGKDGDDALLSYRTRPGTFGHFLLGQRQYVRGTNHLAKGMDAAITALARMVAERQGHDPDETAAKVHAAVTRALAEGTVDVDLDVTIGGKEVSP